MTEEYGRSRRQEERPADDSGCRSAVVGSLNRAFEGLFGASNIQRFLDRKMPVI